MARNRILAVVRDPQTHRNAGAGLLLLIRIIERCGDSETCELNHGAMAAEMGVPVPTVKHWSALLTRMGYIVKRKSQKGVTVHLVIDRMPPAEPVEPLPSCRVIDALGALKTTVDLAIDGVLTILRMSTVDREGAA